MDAKEKTYAEIMEDPAAREEMENLIEGIAMAQAVICTQVKEKARREAEELVKKEEEK